MWTTEVSSTLLLNWGLLLAFVSLLWGFCMLRKDISIIDRFWGPLCAASGTFTLMQLQVYSIQAILLVSLSLIWALRLAYHITQRNWSKGQDFRYNEAESPIITRASSPLATLVLVFCGQATLAWLISMPVQLGQFHTAESTLGLLGWAGVVVWIIGFLFEAVGDSQLKRFKADPANQGKIMDQGLWAWTRHPNYFGDSTVWFGLFLIAAESPLGIYSLFGPVLMLFFLVRMTGKALTEKLMLEKHPAYRAYTQRTSGFFPLPPRK